MLFKRPLAARIARAWGALRAKPSLSLVPAQPSAAGVPHPSVEVVLDPAAIASLLDGFESLGDNCEFSALQRLHGVERPSLLKWAGIGLITLIEILRNDLHGIDDPARFRVRAEPRGDRPAEYMIDHDVLQNVMHGTTNVADEDAERAKLRETRRLTLLKRKFLEDVRSARRIYVFRSLAPISIDHVLTLHAALSRFGPNRLLYVREADATLAAGDMRIVLPGLVEAAIDALATYEEGNRLRSTMWPSLLRDAARLLPESSVAAEAA